MRIFLPEAVEVGTDHQHRVTLTIDPTYGDSASVEMQPREAIELADLLKATATIALKGGEVR